MTGKQVASVVLSVSLLIVVASVTYSNFLALNLAQEEQKKMNLWAEATEQFISADENTDIDFVTTVIEENTTIPVYMTDSVGTIILSRNADPRRTDVVGLHGPIEVRVTSDILQYIYYDDSTLLRQLRYLPYIQFSLIFLFVVVAVFSFYIVQRSEQNRVWAGLSRETAHQLGTPISSLNAWMTLLETSYPSDPYVPQIQQDIDRLQTIAERFSKIGSKPVLAPTPLRPLLEQTVSYMQTRTSDKVRYSLTAADEDLTVMLSAPLFAWVIENLIKNAVDAMEGKGQISICVKSLEGSVCIDIADTGRGISLRDQRRIFNPGFTTKQRGWGLGLSLSKRIVEDYHRGKIFVQSSELGVGTTFRIVLKKGKNS